MARIWKLCEQEQLVDRTSVQSDAAALSALLSSLWLPSPECTREECPALLCHPKRIDEVPESQAWGVSKSLRTPIQKVRILDDKWAFSNDRQRARNSTTQLLKTWFPPTHSKLLWNLKDLDVCNQKKQKGLNQANEYSTKCARQLCELWLSQK